MNGGALDPASGTAFLLVALGGAVGAVLRHVIDAALTRSVEGDYPWGVFTVNVLGSFLLGLLTPLVSPAVAVALGVGLCGALTTFSTLAAQAWGFAEAGRWWRATVVVFGSAVASLAAAGLGLALSSIVR